MLRDTGSYLADIPVEVLEHLKSLLGPGGHDALVDIMVAIRCYNEIIAVKTKDIADAKYAPTSDTVSDLFRCYTHLKTCCNVVTKKLVENGKHTDWTKHDKLIPLLRYTHTLTLQIPAHLFKAAESAEFELVAHYTLSVALCRYTYDNEKEDHTKAIDSLEIAISKFEKIYSNNKDPALAQIKIDLLKTIEYTCYHFGRFILNRERIFYDTKLEEADKSKDYENYISVIEKIIYYMKKGFAQFENLEQLNVFSQADAKHSRRDYIRHLSLGYLLQCSLLLNNSKIPIDNCTKGIISYERAIVFLCIDPSIYSDFDHLNSRIYRSLLVCYQYINQLYKQIIDKIIQENRPVSDEESLLNAIAEIVKSTPINASVSYHNKIAIYLIAMASKYLTSYSKTKDIDACQKALNHIQKASEHAVAELNRYLHLFKSAEVKGQGYNDCKLISFMCTLFGTVTTCHFIHIDILSKLGDYALSADDKVKALASYETAASVYKTHIGFHLRDEYQVNHTNEMNCAETIIIVCNKAIDIINASSLPITVAAAKIASLTQTKARAQQEWQLSAKRTNKIDIGTLVSAYEAKGDQLQVRALLDFHSHSLQNAIKNGDIDEFYTIIDNCNYPDRLIIPSVPQTFQFGNYPAHIAMQPTALTDYVAAHAPMSARYTFQFILHTRGFHKNDPFSQPRPLDPKDSEAYLLENELPFPRSICLIILGYWGINLQKGTNLLYLKSMGHSPAPSHLDKTAQLLLPKPQCKPIWYTDEDINNLLTLAVRTQLGGYEEKCTYKLKCSEIIVLTPAVDSAGKLVALDFFLNRHRAGISCDVFDEIMPALQAKPVEDARIIFSYNLTQIHWLTAEIRIHKQHNVYKIEIFAHDPLGYGQMSEANSQFLAVAISARINFFHPHATIIFERPISPYSRRQGIGDTVSCGPITVEDILSLIKESKLTSQVYPVNAMVLREQQLATMKREYKESDPTLRRFIERTTGATPAATVSKPDSLQAQQFCSKVTSLANLDLKERISNAINTSPTSNYDIYLVGIKSAISELPLLLRTQNIMLADSDKTLINELEKLMMFFTTKEDAELLHKVMNSKYATSLPPAAMDQSDDAASINGKDEKKPTDKVTSSISLSISATIFSGKRKPSEQDSASVNKTHRKR